MESLREQFNNPSAINRSAPFWSWNDDLAIPELERQVAEMADQGLGGFFMHSRVGLLTPYMGKGWMECIRACVKKAKKTGVKAWLYDEDRWPSGFAGGMVPGDVKEHRALELGYRLLSSTEEFPPPDEMVAVFAWNGMDPESIGELLTYDEAERHAGPFIVFENVWCGNLDWFNNGPYPNLLHPGAVEAFIESTYEPYYKEFGPEFGKTIPGIFTDEPQYPAFSSLMGIGTPDKVPWLPDYDEIFQGVNGYSILPHLPKLFFDLNNCEKPRYDFWRTVTDLFVRNFSRKLGDWCEEHGLWLTGHYMCEDSLHSQVRHIGNAMPHYEWMHAPGVDHLGPRIDLLMTMKQVSSVANQLGKPRVLSELYGGSGWDHSFEGQKLVGDWEYSLGVNLRCQHLMQYSLRGCRKRDWLPSYFFHQPWWEHYRMVEDYFGRLSLILSSGKYQPEILLIHPMNSAYLGYTPGNCNSLDELDSSFKKLSTWLCEIHRAYDYGDEGIMERYANVKGSDLVVGEMQYSAVIIPPSKTLQKSTLGILTEFVGGGGSVIAVRPLPTMIDAGPSDGLGEFLKKKCKVITLDKRTVKAALDKVLGEGTSVKDADGNEIADIYVHRRRIADTEVLFLNNISREKAYDVIVSINAIGLVEKWNLMDGTVGRTNAETEEHATRLELHFEPVGSHLISIDASKAPSSYKASPGQVKEETVLTFDRTWRFCRLDPNIITLDYCRYKIGDGGWSSVVPVWKAQNEIRAHFGLRPPASIGRVSFWRAKELGLNDVANPEKVSLSFSYKTNVPETGMSIMLETPDIFEVLLNNRIVDLKNIEMGTCVDACFKTFDIAGLSQKGENEIVLTCDYCGHYELENIYLIGDFGVYEQNGNYVLDNEPGSLESGNWVTQGYPFYSGRLRYDVDFSIEKTDGRYVLRFDELRGIVTSVFVNSQKAGSIIWRPYQLDVGDLLRDGENTISMEIVTSLRNMLGPHHHTAGEDIDYVRLGTFTDEEYWTDSYLFVPYGILGDVSVIRVPD